MHTGTHLPRRRLIGGATLTTLALVTTLRTPAAARSAATAFDPAARPGAAPSAMTAGSVLTQITAEDGTLRFEVAEDGKRFVWTNNPVFTDGLPAHGTTYLSQGYLYPAGTLSDTADGVNADGSPALPDQVLGRWACYGWYIGDGAHATEGPWVLSTQLYDFGDAWGEMTLVSEGYVLANAGGTVLRAITGGTGPFVAARGELADTNLGLNQTAGGNARYAVQLVQPPQVSRLLPPSQLVERPLRGS